MRSANGCRQGFNDLPRPFLDKRFYAFPPPEIRPSRLSVNLYICTVCACCSIIRWKTLKAFLLPPPPPHEGKRAIFERLTNCTLNLGKEVHFIGRVRRKREKNKDKKNHIHVPVEKTVTLVKEGECCYVQCPVTRVIK